MSISLASSAGLHARGVALVAQAQVGRERVGADLRAAPRPALRARSPRRRRGRPSPRRPGATTVPMSRPSITTSPSLRRARAGARASPRAPRGGARRPGPAGRCRGSRIAAVDVVAGDPDAALVVERDRVLARELGRARPPSSGDARAAARATSARGTSRRCRGSGSRAARRAAGRPCSCRRRRARRWRRSSVRPELHATPGGRRSRGSLQRPPRRPRSSTPSRETSPATAPSIAIRWSPRASIVPPREPGRDAADEKPSRCARCGRRARAGRRRRSRCGPSPSRAAPRRRGRTLSPRAMRRGEREQRQLVDQPRHLGGADRRRRRARRAHLEVGDRLAADAAPVEDGDARAHPLEHVEQAGARRVEADAVDRQLASRRAASRRR